MAGGYIPSCRWAFACCLGIFYQMIEYSVGVAWRRQTVGMGVEIIAHGWEYSLGDFAYAYSIKIEGRTGYRHVDEYHIIDE